MDNRDNRNGPGLLFILLLFAVMLGTVWLSSHQTFAAWQKPPPTKEDYLRSLKAKQEEMKTMTEKTKAGTKAIAASLVRDARAALLNKDFSKAISLTNDVLAVDAEYGGAYLVRGIAYYMISMIDESLQDLSRAIALEPHNAEAFFYRGLVKIRQGQPTEAFADLNQAIQMKSEYGAAYYYRGMLRQQAGQTALAQEDFRRACELKVPQACDKVQ